MLAMCFSFRWRALMIRLPWLVSHERGCPQSECGSKKQEFDKQKT
jgi:hypothetical protein